MMDKIKKETYEQIKTEYLGKSWSLNSLFLKYNKAYNISREMFLQIIEKIRIEENLPLEMENKKVKRKNNPYSYQDKHPECYPT